MSSTTGVYLTEPFVTSFISSSASGSSHVNWNASPASGKPSESYTPDISANSSSPTLGAPLTTGTPLSLVLDPAGSLSATVTDITFEMAEQRLGSHDLFWSDDRQDVVHVPESTAHGDR